MPFGKYKNQFLCELPDNYLEWLRYEVDLREPLKSAIQKEILIRQYESKTVTSLNVDTVKKIYWKLAQQYHPDKHGGNSDVMKGINLFYEELKFNNH